MWEMESQRVEFGKALVELGKERGDIVVLGADLSSSTKTSMFDKEFPERFFNFGIAEPNMMCTAAGLAANGKTVFASTFAVFATGRVYDQIRQSIAYPRLNVKIVATHAGITVAALPLHFHTPAGGYQAESRQIVLPCSDLAIGPIVIPYAKLS